MMVYNEELVTNYDAEILRNAGMDIICVSQAMRSYEVRQSSNRICCREYAHGSEQQVLRWVEAVKNAGAEVNATRAEDSKNSSALWTCGAFIPGFLTQSPDQAPDQSPVELIKLHRTPDDFRQS